MTCILRSGNHKHTCMPVCICIFHIRMYVRTYVPSVGVLVHTYVCIYALRTCTRVLTYILTCSKPHSVDVCIELCGI